MKLAVDSSSLSRQAVGMSFGTGDAILAFALQ